MKAMFQHEGWPLVKELFEQQFVQTLDMLLEDDLDKPMSDAELRLLRADLIRADRIMKLDEHVDSQIESLRKAIQEPMAGSADGRA